MKKISSIFIVIAASIMLMSCGAQPGADLGKDSANITWSFIKSPATSKCYETMTVYNSAGYASTTYSGMAQVDDKYCK